MKISYANAALLLASLVTGTAIAHAGAQPAAAAVPAATAQPAASAVSADDAALLEKHCSSCHSVDQVTAANKNAADWAETMDRMIDHGLQITAEDSKRVTAFLAAHYGPKPAAK